MALEKTEVLRRAGLLLEQTRLKREAKLDAYLAAVAEKDAAAEALRVTAAAEAAALTDCLTVFTVPELRELGIEAPAGGPKRSRTRRARSPRTAVADAAGTDRLLVGATAGSNGHASPDGD